MTHGTAALLATVTFVVGLLAGSALDPSVPPVAAAALGVISGSVLGVVLAWWS